jgi:hypothetical protein
VKEKKKRIQGPKRGKVIRVSEFAWSVLLEMKTKKETITSVVDMVINEAHSLKLEVESIKNSKKWYVLPVSKVVCDSLEEARGQAILRFVKGGKKNKEEPVEVILAP